MNASKKQVLHAEKSKHGNDYVKRKEEELYLAEGSVNNRKINCIGVSDVSKKSEEDFVHVCSTSIKSISSPTTILI